MIYVSLGHISWALVVTIGALVIQVSIDKYHHKTVIGIHSDIAAVVWVIQVSIGFMIT